MSFFQVTLTFFVEGEVSLLILIFFSVTCSWGPGSGVGFGVGADVGFGVGAGVGAGVGVGFGVGVGVGVGSGSVVRGIWSDSVPPLVKIS